MTPLALDIAFIVDAGSTVTLIGTDHDTGAHAAIRIDLRPYDAVWRELQRAGLSEAAYAASGLSVSLEFAADEAKRFGCDHEH
jgi:hypothetical protein